MRVTSAKSPRSNAALPACLSSSGVEVSSTEDAAAAAPPSLFVEPLSLRARAMTPAVCDADVVGTRHTIQVMRQTTVVIDIAQWELASQRCYRCAS